MKQGRQEALGCMRNLLLNYWRHSAQAAGRLSQHGSPHVACCVCQTAVNALCVLWLCLEGPCCVSAPTKQQRQNKAPQAIKMR